METTSELILDIRRRAEVAASQDGDAAVHHSAVSAMLRDIADRAEAAYERGYRALQVELSRLEDDYVKSTAENAKLRAALEKVVACRDGACVKAGCSCPAAAAVRRACSVYRKISGNRKEGKTE